MRGKASLFGLLASIGALAVLALAASPAQAAFGIDKWQALTCEENVDVPEELGLPSAIVGTPEEVQEALEAVEQCTDETESKWYRQATGHPDWGITDFTMNTLSGPGAEGFPDGFLKEIVVDTPEGLGVNPEAAPKCTLKEIETTNPVETCPDAIVGVNYFTVAIEEPGPECIPVCEQLRVALPVFNVEPFFGTPSMVAFPTTSGITFIVGSLDPGDQHVIFTISDIESPLEGGPPVVGSRLVFSGFGGMFGNGTYLTMPSNCAGGQTSVLNVSSHPYPIPPGPELHDSESFTTAVGANECESAPFEPGLETEVNSSTDSPESATVDVQMPKQLEAGKRAQSHLLTAKVQLPPGAGINPSLANGLQACTDAQFKKGSDDPVECPEVSRIGSVEVQTNALDQDLGGDVYLAQPLSNDPSSGEQFRIFLHAFNERYGVNVRLVGKIFPNLQTGQLTAVVPENPQAPFNSFKVHVDGGPRGALTTPGTCGPHTTTANYTPWSRPNEEVERTAQFSLQTLPDGAPCPQVLAERPFKLTYKAGTRQSKAGAYTPFDLLITRPDGAQELKQIDTLLPPGMVARLRGLEYCPEANIAAAAQNSGAYSLAAPPCPNTSFVGVTEIAAGSGSEPYKTPGNIYLAGPYKGAPVSLVFATPAVAGPYDLGTVVVRVALHIDPETAEVRAVSDPIPDVFGGVKLDIRSVGVSIYRARFTVNPTTCRRPFPIYGGLYGGASDPTNPAAWLQTSAVNLYQGTNCKALRFKPKFYARIFGGKNQTKRTANPKFRAILDAREGDANLRRAAFILPRATILDQSHIRTICTRVQLAANNCPKAAIYGNAKATSPLLDGNLKGPVYLTSSDNELPDLLVDLKGQVGVRLRGVISAKSGRLKTVFNKTPDVAVNKFTLNMRGGSRGLLVNSQNLCGRTRTGYLNLLAQNSRRMKSKNLRLNIPACR